MERLHVLAVDDEPRMRAGIVRALQGHTVDLHDLGTIGFTLDEAGSAEEALERMDARPPDILFLDHKLPGMQGLELLELLARERRPVLTVMITAYASIETAVTATRRGAYDFLAKPFTPDELRSTLAKAVRHVILGREALRLQREKRQLRFQLISVVAHELKAPLGAIEGYLALLKDPPAGVEDPATTRRMVERSLIRLQGMRKLITDLLDLTRIESGQKRREIGRIDLMGLIRTALETVEPEAKARSITLALDGPESHPMAADPGEVEIVLNNLLTNAVKYNRDSGRVDVTVRPDGDRVTIAVSDTGIGMTPEETGRLFQEFVRIKNRQTRDIMGSGLGLTIVRRIAGLYGGAVRVESEPGRGSTFTVDLGPPVEQPPAPVEPAPA